MENRYSQFKCGEILVTYDGAFSWLCTICNQNYLNSRKFISHICEDHFKNNGFHKLVNFKCTTEEIHKNILPFNECSSGETNQTKETDTENTFYAESQNAENFQPNQKEDLSDSLDQLQSNRFNKDEDVSCDMKIENHEDDDNTSNLDEDGYVDDILVKNDATQKYTIKSEIFDEESIFVFDKTKDKKSQNINEYYDNEKQFEDLDREQQTKYKVKSTQFQVSEKLIFKCKYCAKTLRNIKSFKRHQRAHEKMRIQCDTCPKTFTTSTGLKRHLFLHTGERPHKCEYCPATFTHMSNLKRHTMIHNGEKTFHCKFGCGKAFYVDRERLNHEFSHTGEKPFVCELCGKHYAYKHQLTLHNRLVHMDRKNWPHICDQCGKTFAVPKDLRYHMIVHTGEKAFKCNECDRNFSKPSALREHKKLHSGVRKHVCTICNKAFTQRPGLYGHMKTHNLIQK